MTAEPPPPTPRKPRQWLSWKLCLLLGFFAALGAGGWIFYRIETWPERTTNRILKVFREVAQLQPQVTVHDRVVFEQTKAALELAVVTLETEVEREMEHEWLGSRKRIRIRGTYVVKAGFDLLERFAVKIDGRHITITLPQPKILSVDPKDTEVLVLENGLWNKITPEDLEGEIRALPDLARKKAVETGLNKEALEMLTKRLMEELTPAYEIEFAPLPQPLP